MKKLANESQRALLAARISTVGCGKRANELESANLHFQTVEQVAEALNVSPRSVMSARKVLANGHAALAEAIASGDTPVSVAGGKAAVKTAAARLGRREKKVAKSDLSAVKRAFEALSEDDQMAFVDWLDNELTVTR